MRSALYYEAHVTIDPVFDARREQAAQIAAHFKFRLAKLIMRKNTADTEQPSRDDTFMTGHGVELEDVKGRTADLVLELQRHGFAVRRYKIEDTILDSRADDVFRLLVAA